MRKPSNCVPHIVSYKKKFFLTRITIAIYQSVKQQDLLRLWTPFLEQLYFIGSFIKACFLSSVSHRNQFVHNPMNSGTLAPNEETRTASYIISLYQALQSQWQKHDLIQDGL